MTEDLIYDVGMNNGDDTAYYLSLGYRVVAIEADPTLVEEGRKRFAGEIGAGRVTILNVAIAPEEGVAPFWICPTMRIWNSFDRETATRQGREAYAIEVRCRKFADILREHGTPYYLKIDIEGGDYYCLEGLNRQDLPAYTSIELVAVEWLSQLRRVGYDRFKIIDQKRFTPVHYDPYALPVSKYMERRFAGHPYIPKLMRLPGRVKRKLLRRRGGELPRRPWRMRRTARGHSVKILGDTG